MRKATNKWLFVDNPLKPVLTSSEVAYWKQQAHKNIKVGMEFEFNLPEQKGNCKGDNQACPCERTKTDNCWTECANRATCFGTKSINKCVNRAINCEPEDCASCSHFAIDCPGIFCSGFISKCVVCQEFTTNCANCDLRYDPNKNPDNLRNNIRNILDPNECYGRVNKSGVHSITTDGSLLGNKGVEIITNGRRVDYWEFFKMADEIVRTARENGAYMNERCSIHMHMLFSYYGKMMANQMEKLGLPEQISEMEKDMPEIILANLHQLCRRYQNAITWMTTGLNEPHRLTRWEKFRVSILPVSAILNNMKTVADEIGNRSGKNKYGWIHYKYCQFNSNCSIKRFHTEIRVMDGILCPSVIAAVACMYYALFVKAVEISRYGILEVGDADWMAQTETVKNALLNNMKDYGAGDRFGDTKNLHKYYGLLAEESLELVRQLKHILIKVGPAFQILEKLAEKPVSLHRCEGKNWEEIEEIFAVETSKEDKLGIHLKEFIDLRLVSDCTDVDEWVIAVGDALREKQAEDEELELPDNLNEEIDRYVKTRTDGGDMIWSNTLGSVIEI